MREGRVGKQWHLGISMIIKMKSWKWEWSWWWKQLVFECVTVDGHVKNGRVIQHCDVDPVIVRRERCVCPAVWSKQAIETRDSAPSTRWGHSFKRKTQRLWGISACTWKQCVNVAGSRCIGNVWELDLKLNKSHRLDRGWHLAYIFTSVCSDQLKRTGEFFIKAGNQFDVPSHDSKNQVGQ